MSTANVVQIEDMPTELRDFVVLGSPDPPLSLTETQYYKAMEKFLESRRVTTVPVNGDDDDIEYRFAFDGDLDERMYAFHRSRVMIGRLLLDHVAHTRTAYYPSNVLPLGSSLEETYFRTRWPVNVNNASVQRLYSRRPDFDRLIASHPTCPCAFLFAFNVRNKNVFQASDVQRIHLISVENELMMRSDFFATCLYAHFNNWLYGHVEAEMASSAVTPEHPSPTFATATTSKTAADDTITTKSTKKGAAARKKRACRDASVNRQAGRVAVMREVMNQLFFVADRTYTDVSVERAIDTRIKTLVRSEDNESRFYSPLLALTSCKHTDETTEYVQRRAGDEIATEIRTCRACGAVRMM